MKVFVVTDGIYSDYHIVAVFSSREKAEKFVARYTWKETENTCIEEYSLDQHNIGEMIPCICVELNRFDGEICSHENYIAEEKQPTRYAECLISFLSVYVQTDDVERAYKIAKEKWREWKIRRNKN